MEVGEWRMVKDVVKVKKEHRLNLLPPFLLFFGSLALYLCTLAPSVVEIFSDSLEFQLVCYELGIAHPTGYPLYTLLGRLFTFLPFGDVAYRVNLLSAACGAGTVACLFLVARKMEASPFPALLSALALAASPAFWSQAVVAEVYTLNSLFVALVLEMLLTSQVRGEPYLILAALAYGLSLAHHRSMVLLLPAGLLFLWINRQKFRWSFKLIARATLLVIAPLALYLYIPLRGIVTTSLDGTYQNTFAGFLRHVLASGYGAFLTGNPLGQARSLGFYFDLFLAQFGWAGLGLGLLGFLWMAVGPQGQVRRAFALLALAFASYAAFGLAYRVADIEVFFIPAFLIYALWIGLGADCVWRILRRHALSRLAAGLLLGAAFFQPLLILVANYDRVDRSLDWEAHDYGRDVLSQGLPKNAAVIGILGEMTLLRYFQRTEGLRTDIITIAADREEERLKAVEEALAEGKKVFLTRPLRGLEEKFYLSALGPLMEAREKPVKEPSSLQPPTSNFQLPTSNFQHNGLHLSGYETSFLAPHWQAKVRLTLHWQVEKPPGVDYKISARLYDAGGHLVGQTDSFPVHNAYPTKAWKGGERIADVYDIALLPGAPPGRYLLLAILYEPESGAEVARAELGWIELPGALPRPPSRSLAVERISHVDFGPTLRLLGYTPPSEEAIFKPGERIPLTLLWEGLSGQGQETVALIWRMRQGVETLKEGREEFPVPGRGELLRTWPEIALPPMAPDGTYTLEIEVWRGAQPLPARRWLLPPGRAVELGTVQVRGRERLFSPPDISRPLEACIGEKVKLLGYDLAHAEAQPGETLRLTLYWQALAEMERSYTVFVHLLGPEGKIWGQRDTIPGGGAMPTTGWVKGEIIIDKYDIPVDRAAPSGEYRIEVGLYEAQTGQRLPLCGGEGTSILLPEKVKITLLKAVS